VFLIVENGADPASPAAAEVDFSAGPDVAYIPALAVPVDAGPREAKLRFGLERLRGEWLCKKPEPPLSAGREGLLVRGYLKAVARSGTPPAYCSAAPKKPAPAGADRFFARA
jgi:hypothetical protein